MTPAHTPLPQSVPPPAWVTPYRDDLRHTSALQKERLFRELQPLQSSLLSRYGSDPDLRQELPGEFYCRFHALYESFDPERGVPIRPYLVRCLTVSMYTWARSHWRRRRRELSLQPVTESAADSGGDPASEMQSAAHKDLVLAQLRDAVDRLTPRQREVLLARYYGARSFEEIAQTMGIRPATVRSLVRHAIQSLRRQMETQTSMLE